jgi:ribosome-binding factor A
VSSGSGVKRSARVGERMREELAAALRAMRDPRIEGTLISTICRRRGCTCGGRWAPGMRRSGESF